MALFQSYAVIYLAIGAAIHEVLFVFYSYPNDDTETATFDRTVPIVMVTVFPRNLAAPRIVAAFEISPRSSNAQCTKRRPRILAACGKKSSLF